MKLIIDIEPRYCENMRSEVKALYYEAVNRIIGAVSNGKPYEEKQTGEWIIVKDERYGDNVKCPFCGKELAGTDLNFCCKCGAKLVGSEKMDAGEEE